MSPSDSWRIQIGWPAYSGHHTCLSYSSSRRRSRWGRRCPGSVSLESNVHPSAKRGPYSGRVFGAQIQIPCTHAERGRSASRRAVIPERLAGTGLERVAISGTEASIRPIQPPRAGLRSASRTQAPEHWEELWSLAASLDPTVPGGHRYGSASSTGPLERRERCCPYSLASQGCVERAGCASGSHAEALGGHAAR